MVSFCLVDGNGTSDSFWSKERDNRGKVGSGTLSGEAV